MRNLTQYFARDKWFGSDKMDHFAWSLAYWTVLTLLVTGFWSRISWFAAGAIGVEVVQLVRLLMWIQKGRPHPYPAFADGFSYRDLAWDAAGAITGAIVLAKIVARALPAVLLAFIVGTAAAQQVAKAPPAFDLSGVALDSTTYGQDLPLYVQPMHGYVVRGPGGDFVVILNAVAYDTTRTTVSRACGPSISNTIASARLVVGDRDSVWWTQDFPERGQARNYLHWEQVLPSGDTLRLSEVWRRRSECARADGSLVVLLSFRRGAR